jgi:hypothetical protein
MSTQKAEISNTVERIREIPKTFRKQESNTLWHFREIERVNVHKDGAPRSVRIYERNSKCFTCYEVVIIRLSEPHPKSTQGFDLIEVYPSSHNWGTCGWTFTNLKKARAKLIEVIKG